MRTPVCTETTGFRNVSPASPPMPSAARVNPIRLLHGLLILPGMLAISFVSVGAVAGDEEGGDVQEGEFTIDDNPDAGPIEAERSEQAFDELVSANDWKAGTRNRLTLVLQQRVEYAADAGEL